MNHYKPEQIGKLNGEAVYLNKNDKFYLEKDHSYLVKMTEEEKGQFIKKNLNTNIELNLSESDFNTLNKQDGDQNE